MDHYQGTVELGSAAVSWQSTFDTSVRFQCTHCGLCCFATHVEVLPDEIERIQRLGNYLEPFMPGRFRIAGTEKGKCPFRGSNCTIHGIKPYNCRAFPFKATSFSASKVYIDVSYSCKSILEQRFSPENEVDFAGLVQQHLLHTRRYYQHLPYFEVLHASVQPFLDKESATRKCWDALVSQLEEAENLLELASLQASFARERRRMRELKLSNADDLIRNGLGKREREEWPELYRPQQVRNPGALEATPYSSMELEGDRHYLMRLENGTVRFEFSNGTERSFSLSEVKRRPMDREARRLLRTYLSKVWERHTTFQEFCILFSPLRREKSSFELQVEIARKKTLLLQLLLDLIADKNRHETAHSEDAKEAILMMDPLWMKLRSA